MAFFRNWRLVVINVDERRLMVIKVKYDWDNFYGNDWDIPFDVIKRGKSPELAMEVWCLNVGDL